MRTRYATAVAAASLLALSACSSGGGSADGSGEVTLEWSFWSQGEAKDAMWQDLADKISKQEDQVNVELNQVPFANYFTKYQSQLAAGEAACIVGMQSLRLPAFAETLNPMDDLLADAGFDEGSWVPGSLTALQYEGEQYAVPIGFSTMRMFYNKDMFKAAGVPDPKDGWTIQQFVDAAQQITDETGDPAFGQSFSDLHMYSLLYAYNGARPVTPEGTLDLTSTKMKEAFSWYTSLSTDLGVVSVPASSGDVPWGEQQFLAGNVAMAVDGSWNTVSNAANTDFDIGVVTLPVGTDGPHTYSANSGFGISSNCEHKEDAASVIMTLTGEDSAKQAAENGAETARTAENELYYKSISESIGKDYAKQAREVAKSAGEVATPFISTDNWDEVTKEMARQFLLAYTGDKDPVEALTATQQAVS